MFVRKLVAVACTAAMLMPNVAVGATTGDDPSFTDLIEIMQKNTQPMSFDIGIQGTTPKYTAKITVSGTHSGNLDSLRDTRVDMAVKIAVTGNGESGTATVDIRLVERELYARLRDVRIDSPTYAEFEEEIRPYLNVWVRMTLQDLEEQERFRDGIRKQRLNEARQWTKFLDIKHVRSGARLTSIVTIPEAKKRRFLAMFVSASGSRKARQMLRKTTIDLRSVIETASESLVSSDTLLTVRTDDRKTPVRVTLDAKTAALQNAPVIPVPSGAKSWEELFSR